MGSYNFILQDLNITASLFYVYSYVHVSIGNITIVTMFCNQKNNELIAICYWLK